jgi:hypothetical protein
MPMETFAVPGFSPGDRALLDRLDRGRVWASSFNGLGQRSEPVGPVDFA